MGVGYVSVIEQIDYSTPEGKLFMQMVGGFNEFYSANLGRVVKLSKRIRAKKGLSNSSCPPHGYKRVHGQDAIDPDAAKAAILASYGKKLAVVVQDQLLDYINLRSDRMSIEEERLPHLANVIFFAYRLYHDAAQNTYTWELQQRLPTSSRRLETAFIAGLLGRVPRRDEFERAIAEKVVKVVNDNNI